MGITFQRRLIVAAVLQLGPSICMADPLLDWARRHDMGEEAQNDPSYWQEERHFFARIAVARRGFKLLDLPDAKEGRSTAVVPRDNWLVLQHRYLLPHRFLKYEDYPSTDVVTWYEVRAGTIAGWARETDIDLTIEAFDPVALREYNSAWPEDELPSTAMSTQQVQSYDDVWLRKEGPVIYTGARFKLIRRKYIHGERGSSGSTDVYEVEWAGKRRFVLGDTLVILNGRKTPINRQTALIINQDGLFWYEPCACFARAENAWLFHDAGKLSRAIKLSIDPSCLDFEPAPDKKSVFINGTIHVLEPWHDSWTPSETTLAKVRWLDGSRMIARNSADASLYAADVHRRHIARVVDLAEVKPVEDCPDCTCIPVDWPRVSIDSTTQSVEFGLTQTERYDEDGAAIFVSSHTPLNAFTKAFESISQGSGSSR